MIGGATPETERKNGRQRSFDDPACAHILTHAARVSNTHNREMWLCAFEKCPLRDDRVTVSFEHRWSHTRHRHSTARLCTSRARVRYLARGGTSDNPTRRAHAHALLLRAAQNPSDLKPRCVACAICFISKDWGFERRWKFFKRALRCCGACAWFVWRCKPRSHGGNDVMMMMMN